MKKLVYVLPLLLLAIPGFAEEYAASGITDKAYYAITKGFGIALAVIGGATAQGKAAATAFDGIARNPAAADKLFLPLVIALALLEALVILAFVVTFVGIPL